MAAWPGINSACWWVSLETSSAAAPELLEWEGRPSAPRAGRSLECTEALWMIKSARLPFDVIDWLLEGFLLLALLRNGRSMS
mmetsp:Transcript_70406/g.219851  ORF Transcript_70406/g.219851 Transcript_70406/m.219851 type:complete len:82 (-) Transcript_70406:942-1187(-)